MLSTLASSKSGCLRVSGWPLTNRSLPPTRGFVSWSEISYYKGETSWGIFSLKVGIAGSQGWLVRSKCLVRWCTHSIWRELLANIHNTFPSRKPDQTTNLNLVTHGLGLAPHPHTIAKGIQQHMFVPHLPDGFFPLTPPGRKQSLPLGITILLGDKRTCLTMLPLQL